MSKQSEENSFLGMARKNVRLYDCVPVITTYRCEMAAIFNSNRTICLQRLSIFENLSRLTKTGRKSFKCCYNLIHFYTVTIITKRRAVKELYYTSKLVIDGVTQ